MIFIIIILNYFIYSSLFAEVPKIRGPFYDVTFEDILMIQTEIQQVNFHALPQELNDKVRFIAVELNDLLNTKNIFSEDNTLTEEELKNFMDALYSFYEKLPQNSKKVFFQLFHNLMETDFHFYVTGDIPLEIQQPDIPDDLNEYFEQYRKRIQKHYKKFGISIMTGFDF